MPTVSPSFVGLVVSVEITKTATAALDDSEISELENIVAQSYGVDSDDLTIETEYVTSGIITVDIADSISDEEALTSLTTAIATALGVSEESITLTLDPESGEVSYTVTTNDFDDTAAILASLQSDDIIDTLVTDVVEIQDVTPSDEIVAEVNVVVDADDVTVPLQQAENQVDALLGKDYDVNTESNETFRNK